MSILFCIKLKCDRCGIAVESTVEQDAFGMNRPVVPAKWYRDRFEGYEGIVLCPNCNRDRKTKEPAPA